MRQYFSGTQRSLVSVLHWATEEGDCYEEIVHAATLNLDVTVSVLIPFPLRTQVMSLIAAVSRFYIFRRSWSAIRCVAPGHLRFDDHIPPSVVFILCLTSGVVMSSTRGESMMPLCPWLNQSKLACRWLSRLTGFNGDLMPPPLVRTSRIVCSITMN